MSLHVSVCVACVSLCVSPCDELVTRPPFAQGQVEEAPFRDQTVENGRTAQTSIIFLFLQMNIFRLVTKY